VSRFWKWERLTRNISRGKKYSWRAKINLIVLEKKMNKTFDRHHRRKAQLSYFLLSEERFLEQFTVEKRGQLVFGRKWGVLGGITFF